MGDDDDDLEANLTPVLLDVASAVNARAEHSTIAVELLLLPVEEEAAAGGDSTRRW